jgi:hypothetical protein
MRQQLLQVPLMTERTKSEENGNSSNASVDSDRETVEMKQNKMEWAEWMNLSRSSFYEIMATEGKTLQHITCKRETGTRSEEMTAFMFDRHRRLAGRFIDDLKQPMGNLRAQNNGPPVDSAGPANKATAGRRKKQNWRENGHSPLVPHH